MDKATFAEGGIYERHDHDNDCINDESFSYARPISNLTHVDKCCIDVCTHHPLAFFAAGAAGTSSALRFGRSDDSGARSTSPFLTSILLVSTCIDTACVSVLMVMTFMFGALEPESCTSQKGMMKELGVCFSPPMPVFGSVLGILMPPLGCNRILKVAPLGSLYDLTNTDPVGTVSLGFLMRMDVVTGTRTISPALNARVVMSDRSFTGEVTPDKPFKHSECWACKSCNSILIFDSSTDHCHSTFFTVPCSANLSIVSWHRMEGHMERGV